MKARTVATIALLGAAITAPIPLLVYLFRRPLPKINGTLRLRGLRNSVEVIRDTWGVPHIYAQNRDDLFSAQGFVTAQDRLWQMDLNRRLAQGRLSEIFGEITFNTDHWLRVIGLGRGAENDLAHADDELREVMEAYARGVNAFIETHRSRLPIEFTLLHYKPEPWRPVDSLSWAQLMAWGQGLNWDSELVRGAVIDRIGVERATQLLGEYSPSNPLILHEQSYIEMFDRIGEELKTAHLALHGITPASNNWVVDGAKSETGKPLLANDPHLPLQMPSLWYEVHLVSPEIQAAGVTLPGLPGVVLGHNAEIAWGVTNSFADCQDLYVERLNPDDPTQYEYQGKWERAQVIHEKIRVRGEAKPRVVDVTITQHGPLLSPWVERNAPAFQVSPVQPSPPLTRTDDDLRTRSASVRVTPLPQGEGAKPSPPAPLPEGEGGQANIGLAVRWVGAEPNRAGSAMLKMLRARNWDEFTNALRDWTYPSLSFVYADCAGNIGYYMAGAVPVRKTGKGVVAAPGWTAEYEWTGSVPFEALPHEYNPARHFVATANNQVVGDEYPHFLTCETLNGFRARRIVEMLTAKDKLSADDFERIQVDQYCAPAKTFTELMLAFRAQIQEHPLLYGRKWLAIQAMDALDTWDYNLTADSVGGALYEVTQYFAMRRVFEPWLGSLTDHFLGVGFHPWVSPIIGTYLDRSYLVVQRILRNEESEWLRGREGNPLTSVDILAGALGDAFTFLENELGMDVEQWQWGKLHRAMFSHPLGRVKPLDRIFNRGPFPHGGDTATVWQAAFIPKLPIPLDLDGTASWRQIIDLSDWDASRAIHPTGQSGHPASAHYADMMPMWFKGEYHPMLWTREKVVENAEGMLTLEPTHFSC